MAKKKKQVDWPKIKARYLKDEKPKSIAQDYEGLTPAAITKRANKERWKEEKERIRDNVAQKVEDDFERINKRLLKEYERLALSDMRKVAKWGKKNNENFLDFIDSSKLKDDEAGLIESVSLDKFGAIKIKLHSKLGALDSLSEITGLKSKGQANNKGGQHTESSFIDAISARSSEVWANYQPPNPPEKVVEDSDGAEV